MAEMRESNKVVWDKGNGIGEMKVKLNVDCSEALKGLKAIRREAEKASKALEKLKKIQEESYEVKVSIE
jgi:hypothetical protein